MVGVKFIRTNDRLENIHDVLVSQSRARAAGGRDRRAHDRRVCPIRSKIHYFNLGEYHLAKAKSATKSAGGPNKSDVIREIFKSNPQASLAEVQSLLKERSIKASNALVNKIKYGRGEKGAKKRGGKHGGKASKADAIRGAWSELGAAARPRDVVALLAGRGVRVASAQVSLLRKSAGNGHSTHGVGTAVPYEHLVAAKSLAERLGGIRPAQLALASLARLIEA